MDECKKNGILKWILIIAAFVLLLFVCYKQGWILSGNKNEVSEQEKQEALREAVEEVRDEIQSEQTPLEEVDLELHEMQEEMQMK